jgi:anti-sigma B factor antagonist
MTKVVVQVEFSVSQKSVGSYSLVEVRGEIDVFSAPGLKDALTALIDSGAPAVIIDLSQVAFLDSTGLGALVAARSEATDKGGRLPIVCDLERILKLFRITGLESHFEIHPSVDAAVQALDSASTAG